MGEQATVARPRVRPRQAVPAHDGIKLCTDVYLPDAETAPAVLLRTPYGRHAVFLQALAVRLSRAGFAAVLQDSRGRYQSEGTFELTREHADGVATLEWLADEPWCDGRVAPIGLSITGYPSFRLAIDPVPAAVRVATVVNVMGVIDHHQLFYRDGALVLHWALPWCTMMMANQMGRMNWQARDWDRVFRHQPVAEALIAEFGDESTAWRRVLRHPARAGDWHELDITPRLRELSVPALHVSGWYDFLLGQVVSAFTHAAQGPAAADQRLVIGPWDHQTIFAGASVKPGVSTGPDGDAPSRYAGDAAGVNLTMMILDWLQRWMPPSADARPPDDRKDRSRVMLHVMRDGRWIGADTFPPPDAHDEPWYLTSSGRANGASGDGRLEPAAPATSHYDCFTFDPENPVPTCGGAVWPFQAIDLVPGPADQTAVERRDDVLVYSSGPLAAPLTICGAVRVDLWAATTAHDTDFTAKLVDVDARGVPRVVQDGIVRGRFHASPESETLLEPQRPYRFTIELQAAAHSFARGHAIRIEISSSNFPKFDRNLNSAAPMHTARAAAVAQQTVFHGGGMLSCVHLPVMSASALATASVGGHA